MTLPRILLTAIPIFAASCGFGSYPDKDGDYAKQFPTTPLSNQVCQVDEDCKITRYHDGSCCPEPCNKEPHVFNKDTFERMRAHQEEICKDAEFTCVVNKCSRLNYTLTPRCTDGHCTIEKKGRDSTRGKTQKGGEAKSGEAKSGKAKSGKAKSGKAKAGKRKAGKQRPGKRKVQKRP